MSQIHIVLYHPVIPQNTGSIARLCACTSAILHLIHPLGFSTDDAAVKRAGLDYWDAVEIHEHENWESFLKKERPQNLYFYTKFAETNFSSAKYFGPAYLVFGAETTGLPEAIHKDFAECLYKIPMRTDIVRSLNLAQAAAVVTYEVLRQFNYLDLNEVKTLTPQRLPSWIDKQPEAPDL